jgi:hypothetical protein
VPIYSGGGGGGNTTAQVVASGKVWPAANASGVTVDTTTYPDSIKGGGAKLTTLVFPVEQGALAMAIAGDAFPRVVLSSDPTDYGWSFGDGTVDPPGNTPGFTSSGTILRLGAGAVGLILQAEARGQAAIVSGGIPVMSQISPRFTITSGALPTVALVSGTGAQISTTRDAETITPFTGDGTNNAATCAIAISPDNLTYSTVATISIAAALNLTGVLTDTVNARVPAAWYLKLTAVHGTIGTTTYY